MRWNVGSNMTTCKQQDKKFLANMTDPRLQTRSLESLTLNTAIQQSAEHCFALATLQCTESTTDNDSFHAHKFSKVGSIESRKHYLC